MNRIKAFYNQNKKHQQYLVLLCIVLVFAGIASLIVFMGEGEDAVVIKKKIDSTKRIELSKIASGLKAEDRWLEQAEGNIKTIGEKLSAQEKENKELRDKIEKLESVSQANNDSGGASNLEVLAFEISKLREELELLKNPETLVEDQFDLEKVSRDLQVSKIQKYEVNLGGSHTGENNINLQNYIPAGSYVSAVVISGVDASVGVSSQSEPRPTLFRITSTAKSASENGELQEIDIKGCLVTGAASGDLSSEKVFVRLLKMTCSRNNGKVFETNVHGYVAGTGKAGVRGDVVSREGDFIFKSFLAGIATGAGNALSQRFANPIAIPSGTATQQSSTEDILGSGLGKGIESSSSRLSEYLIKRAEQYQPVISIPSGIEVEIVFNDGVYLDGNGGRNEIQKTN